MVSICLNHDQLRLQQCVSQGVPGFAYVLCATDALKQTQGNARSLTMDAWYYKVMYVFIFDSEDLVLLKVMFYTFPMGESLNLVKMFVFLPVPGQQIHHIQASSCEDGSKETPQTEGTG